MWLSEVRESRWVWSGHKQELIRGCRGVLEGIVAKGFRMRPKSLVEFHPKKLMSYKESNKMPDYFLAAPGKMTEVVPTEQYNSLSA